MQQPASAARCRDITRPRARARRSALTLLLLPALAVGCKEPVVPDYNNPSESDFTSFKTAGQVQATAIGLIAGDRASASNEVLYGETLGRDAYRLDGAEPRYVTGLLADAIDPSNFIGTSMWPYAAIHQADVMIKATRASAATLLTDTQKNATIGFTQTIKALLLLRAIETRDENGIPINTDLPLGQLAPIRCKPVVLDGLAALLDSASTALAAGGPSFPFTLPSGFASFSTPATFNTFAKGLKAKVDIYRGFRDYAKTGTINTAALNAALADLAGSFLVLDATKLDLGPTHTYSASSGDALNPLYQDTASTIYRVNPRVRNEAEAGDRRVATKTAISRSRSLSGTTATSNILFTVYASTTAPIPILTNKELILLRAEANWGLTQDPAALADVNFIRQTDGALPAVSITDHTALLTEILKQKRYSLLWQSGSHWIDARMFGRLIGEPPQGLGVENGYQPLAAFPLPTSEQNGRGGDIACKP